MMNFWLFMGVRWLQRSSCWSWYRSCTHWLKASLIYREGRRGMDELIRMYACGCGIISAVAVMLIGLIAYALFGGKHGDEG